MIVCVCFMGGDPQIIAWFAFAVKPFSNLVGWISNKCSFNLVYCMCDFMKV
jgi:hypothetical protein